MTTLPLSPPPSASSPIDPYKFFTPQLTSLRETLLHFLDSSHPTLTQIAQYYFRQPSKQLRPLLVLLFAHATNGLGAAWPKRVRTDVVNSQNVPETVSSMPELTAAFDAALVLCTPPPPSAPLPHATLEDGTTDTELEDNTPHVHALAGYILKTQSQLAQVVEMIHVASLLHDDVLDASSLRRGAPSAPARFGNKLTVLAGDFLLGRASAVISRFGDSEVAELMSNTIANLVEGEVMQIHKGEEEGEREGREEEWKEYMRKTYLKTGSLIAGSVRAAVILGGASEGEPWKEIAYAYGSNIGLAFQLVDDALDFEGEDGTLGKPGGVDMSLGLATAPALYAWEEHDAMGPLIRRRFTQPGDVDMARSFVRRSKGVERTRDLARTHAVKAREALADLPDSDAKVALENLTERIVQRTF